MDSIPAAAAEFKEGSAAAALLLGREIGRR